MDEAMQPLTLLCVGLYGEVLPNQNGAPVRIVIPWKYGYKSIQAVVKIRLVERQPPTTWNRAFAAAYGFYSNVNPEVDRRWDQHREQRLGVDLGRRTVTRIFNGYGDQVAGLYSSMDLRRDYRLIERQGCQSPAAMLTTGHNVHSESECTTEAIRPIPRCESPK